MTAKPDRSQLGDLLVEMGLVDREQLALAVAHQKANGGRLGRILADRKVVDEDRLAKAIAARLGLEAVNLSSLKIHERVLALIPPGIALKYGALPIAIKRTNQAEFVYVVMADPLDSEALGELARVSGREIRVLVATATELDRALEQHYRPTVVRAPPPEALAPPVVREKSAQLPVPPVVQSPPLGSQPPPPQKSDVPAAKRGLPPPSATTGRDRLAASGGPASPDRDPPTGRDRLATSGGPSLADRDPPPGRDRLAASGGPSLADRDPPPGRDRLAASGGPALPDRDPLTVTGPQSAQARPRTVQPPVPQPAASPSPPPAQPSLPPRMELPRAKGQTGAVPIPPSPIPPPPMPQAGLRPPITPEKKPTLPPLPVRPQPSALPPVRPEPSRSGQTPLPPQSPSQALPRAVPPPAQTGSRGALPAPLPSPFDPKPRASQPTAPVQPAMAKSPSQGTLLPPLRPPIQMRDTPHDFFADSKKTPVPLQAPRVPTSDEDKTGLDLPVDRPSLSDELKVSTVAGGDLENTLGETLGEWDRAVRDWPRNLSSPSISTSQTLPPEGIPMRSALSEPAAPQPVMETPLVIEPVTTESSLKDLGINLAELRPTAVASDVPTSIPAPQAVEEVQVEILEIAEGVDDIKTSQVELTEDYEMLILRASMPDTAEGLTTPKLDKAKESSLSAAKARAREQYALEIPVDISDAPNPFDGPENVDIPVGLERTGIIPAIDWENEEFVPPPLVKQPVQPLLAGSDDIPTSSALARARSEAVEPAEQVITGDDFSPPGQNKPEPRFDTLLEARAAAQETEESSPRKRRSDPPSPTPLLLVDDVVDDLPPPLNDEETPAQDPEQRLVLAPSDDSDSSEMPVIEPSSLVSLMDDDGAQRIQDTGADQVPILHADSNGALPRPPIPHSPPPTLLFDEKDRQLSPVKSARVARELGEEETNPRIDGNSVRAALTSATLVDEPLGLEKIELEKIEDPTPPRDVVARDQVLDDLEGMFIAAPKPAEPPRVITPVNAEDDASRTVEALIAGDSLSSAERAQLVLALGRLLLEKGVITKDELAAELRK